LDGFAMSGVLLLHFTPATLDWLCEILGIESTEAVAPPGITGAQALQLLAGLKGTPDAEFPGGKWATIQHLESCIAAAVDEA
jgi:hypothetical protein